jgi:hypothetical protein
VLGAASTPLAGQAAAAPWAMNAAPDPAPEAAPSQYETLATATDNGVDTTMAVNTIRVAVKEFVGGEVPMIVGRLKTGQPLPAGTIEAVLVLTGEVGMDIEIDIGKGARSSFDYRLIENWVRRCRAVFDYRLIENWVRRCRAVMSAIGERALRYWRFRLRAPGRM